MDPEGEGDRTPTPSGKSQVLKRTKFTHNCQIGQSSITPVVLLNIYDEYCGKHDSLCYLTLNNILSVICCFSTEMKEMSTFNYLAE